MSGLGYAWRHRGYTLVEVGRNYYCACKGDKRVAVGSIRHGDRADLRRRFIAAVERVTNSDKECE